MRSPHCRLKFALIYQLQKKPVAQAKHDPGESALLTFLKEKAGRNPDKKSTRKTRRERRTEKLVAKGIKPDADKKRKEKSRESLPRRTILTKETKQPTTYSDTIKMLVGLGTPSSSSAATTETTSGRPKKASSSGKDRAVTHVGGTTQNPEIKVSCINMFYRRLHVCWIR
jgi:hypothetical protein